MEAIGLLERLIQFYLIIFDNLSVALVIVAKLGIMSGNLLILPIFLVVHPFYVLFLRNAHKGLKSAMPIL